MGFAGAGLCLIMQTMDRLTRLLGMLTLLMGTERITAAALAARFEVSKRTIYRDIVVLEEAGIPVVLFPGKSGGIGIMEGYALDRTILSQGEVLNLMRLLNSFVQLPMGMEQQLTHEKLQLLLNKNQPAGVQQIVIDPTSWGPAGADPARHALLLEGIQKQHLVKFRYFKPISPDPEIRTVEPYSLILKAGYWYLLGFCHSRGNFRQFRFSRMNGLELLPEKFESRPVPQEMLNIKEHWFRQQPTLQVQIRVQNPGVPRITEWLGIDALKKREADACIFEFLSPEDDWLCGLILQFGEQVELLAPVHLRAVIAQKALRIYEHHQKMTPSCHTVTVT